MASKGASRGAAVAPQLTGIWIPWCPTDDVKRSVEHGGLASIAALSPTTLAHLAAVSGTAGDEPWSGGKPAVLAEYLSRVFARALSQRCVYSFHGRIFSKTQMSTITVKEGSEGTPAAKSGSALSSGVAFANVAFAPVSGNAVVIQTDVGKVTVTARSRALLFSTGLLDAAGLPLYALLVPPPSGSWGSAGQSWLMCWALSSESLSDKASPPLNSGLEHSRTNVKDRLEALPLEYQPPSVSFLADAPPGSLALDPRLSLHYSLSATDPGNMAALPMILRSLPAPRLALVVQQAVEESMAALRYNYRDALAAWSPLHGYHWVAPVSMTPTLSERLSLPKQPTSAVMCAAVVCAMGTHGSMKGGVMHAIVALQPLHVACASARLMGKTGCTWLTGPPVPAAPPATLLRPMQGMPGSAVAGSLVPVAASAPGSAADTAAATAGPASAKPAEDAATVGSAASFHRVESPPDTLSLVHQPRSNSTPAPESHASASGLAESFSTPPYTGLVQGSASLHVGGGHPVSSTLSTTVGGGPLPPPPPAGAMGLISGADRWDSTATDMSSASARTEPTPGRRRRDSGLSAPPGLPTWSEGGDLGVGLLFPGLASSGASVWGPLPTASTELQGAETTPHHSTPAPGWGASSAAIPPPSPGGIPLFMRGKAMAPSDSTASTATALSGLALDGGSRASSFMSASSRRASLGMVPQVLPE